MLKLLTFPSAEITGENEPSCSVVVYMELGIKPRIPYKVGMHSRTELYPWPQIESDHLNFTGPLYTKCHSHLMFWFGSEMFSLLSLKSW